MEKIKITDSEGNALAGTLPQSWANISISQYASLSAAATWPDRCRAVATLCDLPAQPFLDDVSLCLPILKGAPFLLNGPLPAAADAIPPAFTHAGVTYEPAPADLDKINGDQMEALSEFLSGANGSPLAAAPYLLATLYKPAGATLTAEVLQASAAAFASLPMATGYPLLLNFYQRSENTANTIQKYLALRPVVAQTLSVLETLSQASASSGASWSLRRWLVSRWLKRVSKLLRTF